MLSGDTGSPPGVIGPPQPDAARRPRRRVRTSRDRRRAARPAPPRRRPRSAGVGPVARASSSPVGVDHAGGQLRAADVDREHDCPRARNLSTGRRRLTDGARPYPVAAALTPRGAPRWPRPSDRASETTFADLLRRRSLDNIERVIQGKPEVIELVLLCLRVRGPPAHRGRARRRQDQPGQGAGRVDRLHAAAGCSSPPTCCPTDVVGRHRVEPRRRATFEFRPGPVFANIVLADEINRASPKTQSALLEAMAERQVTVDGTTYPLAQPVHGDRHPEPDRARGHLPAAREPARPLPHAGLGRLPATARPSSRSSTPTAITTPPEHRLGDHQARGARAWSTRPRAVHVAPDAQGLPGRPGRRHPPPPGTWPSACRPEPRCRSCARRRARAAAAGRNYVVPDDVKALAEPVLAHRLILSDDAGVRGVSRVGVVEEVLASVPVPTAR